MAIVAAASFCGWLYALGGAEIADRVLTDNHSSLYGTLASLFGSLFGFAITAASIILGFASSPRLDIVRKSGHLVTISRVLSCTIVTLGLATLAALTGFLVDRDNAPSHFTLCIVALAFLLSCVRMARTVWVLSHIMRLVARRGAETL